jgi:hypothetical protein
MKIQNEFFLQREIFISHFIFLYPFLYCILGGSFIAQIFAKKLPPFVSLIAFCLRVHSVVNYDYMCFIIVIL